MLKILFNSLVKGGNQEDVTASSKGEAKDQRPDIFIDQENANESRTGLFYGGRESLEPPADRIYMPRGKSYFTSL